MSKPKPTRRKPRTESHKAGKIPADALKVLMRSNTPAWHT